MLSNPSSEEITFNVQSKDINATGMNEIAAYTSFHI